jgi:peroxiredoxin (alkyl hydroperoxide reductase subunit C)
MRTLIGKKAPKFNSPAVINGGEIIENFSFDQYIGEKYILFFFYPADFTFVCPTEIIAFQKRLADFESRNVQVVGCSVDSAFSHWKWLDTPKKEGGIKGVKYPIVADQSLTISDKYGVLAGKYVVNEEGEIEFEGVPQAYRGLFIIDKEGIVRHMLINDMPLGRSVDEALRVVDALQYCEKHGEVCPADWHEGEDALTADQEGISDYLSNH